MNLDSNALHLLIEEEIYLVDQEPTLTPNKTDDIVEENVSVEVIETKVSIICKEELSSDENLFLEKIMKAATIPNADYTLITSPSKEVLTHTKSPNLIAFNVSPVELGINDTLFPLYELKEYNKTLFIFGETLSSISQNTDKKQALWLSLKRMFSIS